MCRYCKTIIIMSIINTISNINILIVIPAIAPLDNPIIINRK